MKGFRTLAINAALAVLPILQATGAADLGLTGIWANVYGGIVAIANIGLRFITTTPVGKSQ